MLLVGDTNLEIWETLENDLQFSDTFYQSRLENFAPRGKRLSKYRGTYLLVRKENKVIYVRPDRILVNKAS